MIFHQIHNSTRRRRHAVQLSIATFALSLVTLSYYYLEAPTVRVLKPRPAPLEIEEIPRQDDEHFENNILHFLSSELYAQIERLSSSDCNQGFTLRCGHFDICGLGCQLHHRAVCLMLSYSMGIPLIHDSNNGWQYDTPWERIFQPLGSKCIPNERTITVEWFHGKRPILVFNNNTLNEIIQYPFEEGIPVDAEFFRLLKDNHPNPFLWFVGQFLKYTMRLSYDLSPEIDTWLEKTLKLPTGEPLVGFHVRRTDKITEAKDSFHEIDDYVGPAEAFVKKAGTADTLPHTVYIASDDHTVLTEAQKKYPRKQWRFIGQETNETFRDQYSRTPSRALISAIKDILVLSKCDFVVCGLSSNMCRLVYELLNADHTDASERIKSLDQYYQYVMAGHVIPEQLIPVHPTSSSPSDGHM